MSGAEMQEMVGALKNQGEQNWTCHQVVQLNEMNSVAGDALENQRRSLLSEATAELQRHQRQSHKHPRNYQQGVRRHLSEVQQEVQVHRLRVKKNCLSLLRKSG